MVSLVKKYCNPTSVIPPANTIPEIIDLVTSKLSLNVCLKVSATESVVRAIMPDIVQKKPTVNAVTKETSVFIFFCLS